MTRTPSARRGAVLLAAAVAALAGLVVAGPSQALAPAGEPATVSTSPAASTTTLTFEVTGCNGCTLRLIQAVDGEPDVWESRARRVRDGEVAWTIASEHTHGLSVALRAPWEGPTGFVTQVAFRYGRQAVGSTVPFATAHTKKRASGCWAGTDEAAVTLPLSVRRVRVPGEGGQVIGALAWTPTTQESWRPMLAAFGGVVGSQDVIFCSRP